MYIRVGDSQVKEEYVDDSVVSKRFNERPALKKRTANNPIQMYLMQIGEIPLLTKEEEVECAKQIADTRKEYLKAGTLEKRVEFEKAKHELARGNLRLVVSIAKKYRGFGLGFLDLIQEGNKGLMTAVDKYDHTFGYRFSTYASHWIRQAIRRAIVGQSRTIRVPQHMLELIRKLKKVQGNYLNFTGRMPTPEELADEVGISIDKITWALKASRHPTSLDKPAFDGEEKNFKDLLEDKNTKSPAEVADYELVKEKLVKLVDTLPWIEREVIRLRFGIGDGGETYTLEQVGKMVNKTRERVRQIEERGIRRLGIPERNKGLECLL